MIYCNIHNKNRQRNRGLGALAPHFFPIYTYASMIIQDISDESVHPLPGMVNFYMLKHT